MVHENGNENASNYRVPVSGQQFSKACFSWKNYLVGLEVRVPTLIWTKKGACVDKSPLTMFWIKEALPIFELLWLTWKESIIDRNKANPRIGINMRIF